METNIITNASGKVDTSCHNCGICCKKGGPALHTKDGFLFEEKILRVQDVLTIRTGELVRDDMKNILVPLPNELIKVAPVYGSRPDDWTCRFLTSNNRCFLHGKHPAECRAFYCKEPEALMQLTHEERLTREVICKLVNAPDWWMELINTHEEHVAYGNLAEWVVKMDAYQENFVADFAEDFATEEENTLDSSLTKPNKVTDKVTDKVSEKVSKEEAQECRQKFLEAVEYDRAFRELVLEKNAANEEELYFLFGRPLLQTMVMFGYQARVNADKISLVKMTD